MAGSSPAMTKQGWFRRMARTKPACFPALLAPNKDREIGGGRATRQPGQVRKEAALTRSGSGRSSVSYLFFERIAQKAATFALSARAPGVYSAKMGAGFATRMRVKLSDRDRPKDTQLRIDR